MTYEQAVQNQWTVAYHRIMYAKENLRPCRCEDCREHLAAIKSRDVQLESIAREQAVSQEAQ